MSSEKNSKTAVAFVAQAGLLIALLVVVQLLAFVLPKSVLLSQLLTGSLVNLVLIVGAGTVGFSGTAAAAILSPVFALLFGQMNFPQMVPVVAVGNLVIVAVTWAFFKNSQNRKNGAKLCFDIAGIAAGAVVKTAVLWGATALLVVPVFFAGSAKIGAKLSFMFSWPQLVTAVIGGILAVIILPVIRKSQKNRA